MPKILLDFIAFKTFVRLWYRRDLKPYALDFHRKKLSDTGVYYVIITVSKFQLTLVR